MAGPPIQLDVIQRNVVHQLNASRQLIGIASQLQSLAKSESDTPRRAQLESTAKQVLELGQQSVESANEVGQLLRNVVTSAW